VTRVFVEDSQIEGDRATITGPDAHHLLHVLRLEVGDRFVVVDARGDERDAEIADTAGSRLVARLGAPTQVATEAPVALTLYHGLPRTRRFETALQMGTEIGVAAFVPMLCARTVARIKPEQAPAKAERWQRIARAAARQCGRTRVPEVLAPMPWSAALEHFRGAGAPGVMPVVTLSRGAATSLRDCLRDLSAAGPLSALSLFIGPEGGFDLTEEAQARATGIHLVTLGPRVLRSETAALAAIVIALHELGALD